MDLTLGTREGGTQGEAGVRQRETNRFLRNIVAEVVLDISDFQVLRIVQSTRSEILNELVGDYVNKEGKNERPSENNGFRVLDNTRKTTRSAGENKDDFRGES